MNTHMDPAIFHLKASVPATSLYILICSILDEGETPTLERAKNMWSGTEENLKGAIEELTQRGILESAPAWANSGDRLYLAQQWRKIV